MKLDDSLNVRYKDYIKQHILTEPSLSDANLIDMITSINPNIDIAKLSSILDRKMKFNVGIAPMFITPEGCFMVAGLSGREGGDKRGAVLIATGAMGRDDRTILDVGCRELYEELGFIIGDITIPNIKFSFMNSYSKLGENIESVADKLSEFISHKKSISYFVNILTPIFTSSSEMQRIIDSANEDFSNNERIYKEIVPWIYGHKKNNIQEEVASAQKDFLKYADDLLTAYEKSFSKYAIHLLNTYEKHFSKYLTDARYAGKQREKLKDLYEIANSKSSPHERTKAIHDLLLFMIDITENTRVLTLKYKDFVTQFLHAAHEPSKLIKLTVNNGVEQEFMPVCLEAVKKILMENKISINSDELRNIRQNLINAFYDNINKSRSNEKQLLNESIVKPLPFKLSAPNLEYNLQKSCLELITELLYAGHIHNPRSLSLLGLRKIALGALYARGVNNGVFLSYEQIPSHVSAAQLTQLVKFIKIKNGNVLFQHVRPQGFIGDYYVQSEGCDSEKLGISSEVTNPLNNLEVVKRVEISFLVLDEQDYDASITLAASVYDTWSIKNKSVWCIGGGEQIYLPLNTNEKQKCFRIIAPDTNHPQYDQVIAIAKNNKIQLATQDEISKLSTSPRKLFAQDSYNVRTSLEDIFSLVRMGSVQSAITMLKHYINAIEHNKEKKHEKYIGISLLFVLSCVIGDNISAANYYDKYMQCFKDRTISHGSIQSQSEHAQEMHFICKYHLARIHTDNHESIRQLNELLPLITDNELGFIIRLDIAIRYNQLAGAYSDEITYDNFDKDGVLNENIMFDARNSEIYLKFCLKKEYLPTSEQIVALMELAFSLHKQKKYEASLNYLHQVQYKIIKVKETLENKIIDGEKTLENKMNVIFDLDLQALGVSIGIGLNLARLQKNKHLIPYSFRGVDYIDILDEIAKELDNIHPMKAKLLLERLVGSNVNNLFIEGWYNSNEDSLKQGTNLIAIYRKYIPLDIIKISEDLESNRITQLDLAYLGASEPGGISDELFVRLCDAISKNESLKKLYIRKFSSGKNVISGAVSRPLLMFKALSDAQKNGQRLQYLSYSSSKFCNIEERNAALEYLKENKSLIVFQPSLYDWKKIDEFRQFAEAIAAHPKLVTILTGMIKVDGAGEVLYETCINSLTLKNIHIFPGTLQPGRDAVAIVNNNAFIRLERDLKERAAARMREKSYLVKHFDGLKLWLPLILAFPSFFSILLCYYQYANSGNSNGVSYDLSRGEPLTFSFAGNRLNSGYGSSQECDPKMETIPVMDAFELVAAQKIKTSMDIESGKEVDVVCYDKKKLALAYH